MLLVLRRARVARIVDEASLACCKRVVVRREGAGSSFLGSPPAKRDSGETLAFPAAAGSASQIVLCGRMPRATVAGASARSAAKPVTELKNYDIVSAASGARTGCNAAAGNEAAAR